MELEAKRTGTVSPFFGIWTHPGQTVAALVSQGRGHPAALFIAASFALLNCRRWLLTETTSDLSFNWSALPAVLVLSALAGLALLYLYSWLFRNFGRWMGGTGGLRAIRTAMGWGMFPATVLLALVFFIPSGTWITVTEAADDTVFQAFNGWGFLLFGGLVYSYGVFLLCLAAAHRLTALRAFGALAVTFLVSIIPLSILVQTLLPS